MNPSLNILIFQSMGTMILAGYLYLLLILLFNHFISSSSNSSTFSSPSYLSLYHSISCAILLLLHGLGCLLSYYLFYSYLSFNNPYSLSSSLPITSLISNLLTLCLFLCFITLSLYQYLPFHIYIYYPFFFFYGALHSGLEILSQYHLILHYHEIPLIYIGLNPIMFSIGNIIGFLIYLGFRSAYQIHYNIISVCSLLLGAWYIATVKCLDRDGVERYSLSRSVFFSNQLEINSIEFICCIILFCSIGSVDATYFLWRMYLEKEIAVSPICDSNLLYFLYLLSSTCGKILGAYVRSYLTQSRILLLILFILLLGIVSCTMILLLKVFYKTLSDELIHILVVIFGLCHGPIIPLVIDISLNFQHNLSQFSPIHHLLLSLYLGSIFIPFLTYMSWLYFGSNALILMILVVSIICLPLVWYLSTQLRYRQHQNGYCTIPEIPPVI